MKKPKRSARVTVTAVSGREYEQLFTAVDLGSAIIQLLEYVEEKGDIAAESGIYFLTAESAVKVKEPTK